MGLRIGDMRHRVLIEQRTPLQDTAGQPVFTWLLVAERWAAMERSPGRELWSSAQRSGRVPSVFRLRYFPGVTPAMRLTCEGTVYNILSAVDQAGKGEELVITAEALVEVSP